MFRRYLQIAHPRLGVTGLHEGRTFPTQTSRELLDLRTNYPDPLSLQLIAPRV